MDFERRLLALCSWFAPELDFLGSELPMKRQLCLMTWEILQLLNVRMFDPLVNLQGQELQKACVLYIWLHTDAPAEICSELISGAWRKRIDHTLDVGESVLSLFVAHRAHLMSCVQASDFRVLPRPAVEGDKTPPEVIPPPDLAARLRLVMDSTGLSDQHLLWHLFYPQFLQLEHAARYWNGGWTAPLARDTRHENYDDLIPDFMKGHESVDNSPPAE